MTLKCIISRVTWCSLKKKDITIYLIKSVHNEVGGQPDLLKTDSLKQETSITLTSFTDERADCLLPEVCFCLPHLSLSFHLSVCIFLHLPSLLHIAPIVPSDLYKDVLFLYLQVWCVFRGET